MRSGTLTCPCPTRPRSMASAARSEPRRQRFAAAPREVGSLRGHPAQHRLVVHSLHAGVRDVEVTHQRDQRLLVQLKPRLRERALEGDVLYEASELAAHVRRRPQRLELVHLRRLRRHALPELRQHVLRVGHGEGLRMRFHVGERELVRLVDDKLEGVESQARAREEIRSHELRARLGVLDCAALEELAAHQSRILLRGLEYRDGVVLEEELEHEHALGVLRFVRIEAGHEAEDLTVVLHHLAEVFVRRLGDEVDKAAQRVFFVPHVERQRRGHLHLRSFLVRLELHRDVRHRLALVRHVPLARELVAAVYEKGAAVDHHLRAELKVIGREVLHRLGVHFARAVDELRRVRGGRVRADQRLQVLGQLAFLDECGKWVATGVCAPHF
mmetsp:Transcript_42520/g.104721  ORF Transcript_42520/g.104721 Transcript_42520/m.104721 type:complete len:386 (-) Transcript_42520:938-2095(-)